MDDKDGAELPSVTTVLQRTMPFGNAIALGRWTANEIKKHGRKQHEENRQAIVGRGSRMHAIIERYLTQREEPASAELPEDMQQLWESVHPVLLTVGDVRVIESAVLHRALGFAGTVDCVARLSGQMSVIDWKTSHKVKRRVSELRDYPLQVAAYRAAILADADRFPSLQGESLQATVVVMCTDGSPATVTSFSESECDALFAEFQERLQQFRTGRPSSGPLARATAFRGLKEWLRAAEGA